MSVSLILLPVALAMYVVMGKENMDKWIDSMQTKIPTTFASKDELVTCVRKAGFDANDFGGMVKTHLKGESLFFFWQLIDGKWVAVFGKNDPHLEIKYLIREVEAAAGKPVFVWEESDSVREGQSASQRPAKRRVTVLEKKLFPTNFRDKELLLRVLAEYSLNPTVDAAGTITCTGSGCMFVFTQQNDQPFVVEVLKAPSLNAIYDSIAVLDAGYAKTVQAEAVRNVKNSLHERGLALEHEEILQDNTVVLTVQIP